MSAPTLLSQGHAPHGHYPRVNVAEAAPGVSPWVRRVGRRTDTPSMAQACPQGCSMRVPCRFSMKQCSGARPGPCRTISLAAEPITVLPATTGSRSVLQARQPQLQGGSMAGQVSSKLFHPGAAGLQPGSMHPSPQVLALQARPAQLCRAPRACKGGQPRVWAGEGALCFPLQRPGPQLPC